MKIFGGVYSWDGKRHGSRDPIAWFPGSYNLLLFDLSEERKSVTLLKPYLCVYSETGHGHSISANPEKFVKHVCEDFCLDLDRVLWVEEILEEPRRFEVIVLSKSGRLGENLFYQVRKRIPTASELDLIEKHLECQNS